MSNINLCNQKNPQACIVHCIVVLEGYKSVANADRTVPVAIKYRLRAEVCRMAARGVVEKVQILKTWVKNMVAVQKQNEALRICLDPCELNKVIVQEWFQLPTQEKIFSDMTGATTFSKLNASSAFCHVKLDCMSKHLTSFGTSFGGYQHTRLPYWLCSSIEAIHTNYGTDV